MGTKHAIAAAALAVALAACPAPALAQTGNTGTTEVTVVAGPGWGQTEGSGTAKPAGGRMPQTGDPAAWAPLLLAGAAACGAGLVVASFNREGDANEHQE